VLPLYVLVLFDLVVLDALAVLLRELESSIDYKAV
jgi:hypothetical protein